MEDKSKVLDAAAYAICSAVRDPTLRRVFMQDFIAALNRKGILSNEETKKLHGIYVNKVTKCSLRQPTWLRA
mgnify:CR=1 FL=1